MEIPFVSEPRKDTGLYNSKVGIWLFLASEVMLFGAFFSSYILLRVGAVGGSWPQDLLNIPVGTINTIVLILSSVTVVMAWSALKLNQYKKYQFYQTITVVCAAIFLIVKCFYEYPQKWNHIDITKTDGIRVDGHNGGHFLADGTPIEGSFYDAFTGDMPEGAYTMVGHAIQYPAEKGISYRSVVLKGHEDSDEHDDEAAADEGEAHDEGAAEAHDDDHHGEAKVLWSEIATFDNGDPKVTAWLPKTNTYFAIYFTMTALHGLHVLGGALMIGYLLWFGQRMWITDPERYINRVEVSGLFWHFVDLVWIFLFPVLYLL